MIDAKRWSAVTAGAGLVLGMAVYGCSTEAVDDNSSSSGGSSSGATSSSSGGGGSSSSSSSSSGSSGTCTALTVGEFSLAEDDQGVYPGYYIATITPGNADEDDVEIEIISDATGTFDLSQAPNDNYGTCQQCISVFAGGKTYFPIAGTLTISADSTPDVSKISGTLANLKLVEVTIADDETLVSTPVDNGACVTIATGTVEVDEVLEDIDAGDDDGGDDDSTDGG